jgi:uncharacterized coiled-coil protein SlyX
MMSDTNQTTRQPQRGLTFDDVWAAMMETERRFQETDRRFQETDRMIKENAQQMKETDRKIDRIGKQIGDVHNKFGKMAEHMVAPSISSRFNELGFHFDAAADGQKMLDGQGRILAEIDLLLENGDYIIAVEVKVEPKEADISHHLKRLEILRARMDRRGDKRKIRGAIAGAIYDKAVKEAVSEAGMYVVAQSGDTMKIEMPEDFIPRDWEPAL